MDSRRLAVISLLVAVSTGTNYIMIFLPNVNLMDFIVFVSGFCFGALVGSSTGIISWAVYGTLNPLGFSLPVWFATMLSEPIYGIAGAFIRKKFDPEALNESKDEKILVCGFFAVLGIFLTCLYDVITNVVFGYVSNWDILIAVIFGFVPLGLIHMLSNAFFFGIGGLPVIKAILNIVGGERFWHS